MGLCSPPSDSVRVTPGLLLTSVNCCVVLRSCVVVNSFVNETVAVMSLIPCTRRTGLGCLSYMGTADRMPRTLVLSYVAAISFLGCKALWPSKLATFPSILELDKVLENTKPKPVISRSFIDATIPANAFVCVCMSHGKHSSG